MESKHAERLFDEVVERPPFPELNEVSFPELEEPQDAKKLRENISSLAKELEELDISHSAFKILELLSSPASFEDFKMVDDILPLQPENLGLKHKLYSFALMSLMEFCQTYGCPKESEELARRWLEEKEKAFPERLREPLPLLPSEDRFKEILKKERFVAKDVMATRLLQISRKASHYLSEGNLNSFLALLSELPDENRARAVATSLALTSAAEKNLPAVQEAVKRLKDEFSLLLPERSSLEFGPLHLSTTTSQMLLEKTKGRVAVEVREKNARPIIVETYGKNRSLLIIVAPRTSILLRSQAGEQPLSEGKYSLKGPLQIEVKHENNKVLYDFKEPAVLNVVIKVKESEEL